jgi:hypothetical protein
MLIKKEINKFHVYHLKEKKPGMVAYACDPSYIRGGGWQTEASPGKKHEILI